MLTGRKKGMSREARGSKQNGTFIMRDKEKQ